MKKDPAIESRREAHEKVDKVKLCEMVLNTFVDTNNRPMSSMVVADILGLPYTSIRPRFTELSNREWCIAHMKWNQALLKKVGRVPHPKSRTKVTAYVLTLVGEAVTKEL